MVQQRGGREGCQHTRWRGGSPTIVGEKGPSKEDGPTNGEGPKGGGGPKGRGSNPEGRGTSKEGWTKGRVPKEEGGTGAR